jgi:polysaccharide export outer membrane protein
MRINVLVIVVILLLFSQIFADTSRIDPDEYIVKVGDVFLIQTLLADTLTVRTPVLPTGSLILYPIADSVMVAGKTLSEVNRIIDRKIGTSFQRDKVIIQLGRVAPYRFHVMGAVRRPGEQYSKELVSLQQALAISGGLTSNASKRVKILRNKQMLEFDLNKYLSGNDIKENPLIMHDDVIMINLADRYVKVYTNNDTLNFIESIELEDSQIKVSDALNKLSMRYMWSNLNSFTVERKGQFQTVDREFLLQPFDQLYISVEEMFIYVTGNVTLPGKYPYNGNVDVSYYLSQGGGITPIGSKNKIYIIKAHGKQELYKGQAIQPGDTIYVPESFRSIFTSYLAPISALLSIVSTVIIVYVNM